MIESLDITVDAAPADSAPLLANLLELYIHDLSEIFALQPGVDGRFGYPSLPLYWSHPDTHFPFFIRLRGRAVGFALVTRGSPATDDPADLDLAEFFVLRSCRRAGVGRRAAIRLWNRMPGQWVVRASLAHQAGLRFWETTIQEYTRGAVSITAYQGKLHPFRVFAFRSAATPPAV